MHLYKSTHMCPAIFEILRVDQVWPEANQSKVDFGNFTTLLFFLFFCRTLTFRFVCVSGFWFVAFARSLLIENLCKCTACMCDDNATCEGTCDFELIEKIYAIESRLSAGS